MSAATRVPWWTLGLGLAVAAGGAVVAVGLGLMASVAGLSVVAGYVVGAVLTATAGRGTFFGLASVVTLSRVVGTCWVGGLVLEGARGDLGETGRLLIVGLGAVCLVLDWVDGRVARARAEVSTFGARFDMETDAALLLLLSLALPVLGVTGWWVLAIGAMRYAYGLATVLIPILRIDVGPTLAGRVVAVSSGIALLLALLLSLLVSGSVGADGPRWVASVPPALALAALCWSFARHILRQLDRATAGELAADSRTTTDAG